MLFLSFIGPQEYFFRSKKFPLLPCHKIFLFLLSWFSFLLFLKPMLCSMCVHVCMQMFMFLCKWSSGWASLLQMIIRMDWPYTNDYLDGKPFCKWPFGWAGLMPVIIQMGRPFANDHLDGLAFCKWSSGWTGLLQMIIRMSWLFANNHLDFFLWTRFLFFSKSED